MLEEAGMDMIQSVYDEVLLYYLSHYYPTYFKETSILLPQSKQNQINLGTHSHNAELCCIENSILGSNSG